MIIGLFGSETAEKTMLYMANYERGYALEIANTFEISVSQIQRQLEKFEREGVFVSQLIGKTRVYQWNPRYFFKEELLKLLKKALTTLPQELVQKYYRKRTRPRRKGKPL